MEAEILREKNFVLSSVNTRQGVKIIIRYFKYNGEEIYEAKLPSIDGQEIISKFFDSSQELIDHMKVRQNIEIDVESMTIKVLYCLNSTKTKYIEIFKVRLVSPKQEMKERISSIIGSCNFQGDLTNDAIKKSIQIIAESLYKLMTEKESQKNPCNCTIPSAQFDDKKQFKLFQEEVNRFIQESKKEKCMKQNFKQLIQINIQSLSKRAKKLEERLGQQYSKIVKQTRQLCNKVWNQVNQKMKELSKMFATSQETQIIVKKLRVLGLNLQKLHQKIDPNYNLLQNQAIPANLIESTQSRNYFRYQSQFKESGNQIEYIGKKKLATHYIFNKEISNNEEYRFKIRILQLKQSSIYIGILNYLKQRNNRSSYSSSYCYGSNGKGYNYVKIFREGRGFKEGDLVQVTINFREHNIKWIVNGIKEAQIYNQFIGNNKITFRPFVEFWMTNAVVQWANEERQII